MSKDSEKKRKTYNKVIIDSLLREFVVSKYFIGMSLRGERNSLTSIKICDRYKELEKKINETIERAENE